MSDDRSRTVDASAVSPTIDQLAAPPGWTVLKRARLPRRPDGRLPDARIEVRAREIEVDVRCPDPLPPGVLAGWVEQVEHYSAGRPHLAPLMGPLTSPGLRVLDGDGLDVPRADAV